MGVGSRLGKCAKIYLHFWCWTSFSNNTLREIEICVAFVKILVFCVLINASIFMPEIMCLEMKFEWCWLSQKELIVNQWCCSAGKNNCFSNYLSKIVISTFCFGTNDTFLILLFYVFGYLFKVLLHVLPWPRFTQKSYSSISNLLASNLSEVTKEFAASQALLPQTQRMKGQ